MLANLERLRQGVSYESAEDFWNDGPLYQMPRYTGERHDREYHRPYKRTAARIRDIFRTYVDAGYYAEQIERYLRLFPREQIRIYFAEDLPSRPTEVLQEVCELIGVRTEPISANHARFAQHEQADETEQGRQILAGEPAPRLQRIAYGDIRNRPSIRPEFRQFRPTIRPFNAELSKLLNRDLSHWS